jgi:hypothetical protein
MRAFCSAGLNRTDIERGQVIGRPGSITPHTKFQAEVYILSKDEGGRHTPFFTGYRPQFYFRTTDVTGSMNLPEGVEMVMPGDKHHHYRGAGPDHRDGRGSPVRDPRRRAYRRGRGGQQSHRVRLRGVGE